jgi:hypothetical protein
MKANITTAARILLGLVFVVFGLNGFLHFLPMPPMEGAAATFIGGLAASGYFFPLMAGTQTIAGAALLTRRYVPLALIVLAPIIVNIVAVHLLLAPAGLPLAILVLGLEVFLAWANREASVRFCVRVTKSRR